MAEKKSKVLRKTETARTTISLPTSDYEQLELIAHKHKVSIAWVVRDAVELYLRSANTNRANKKHQGN